ncbi:hypothetical protein B0A55_02554 [Friedmanniomyces simplex]|uniref:G domain-containing protein n=1 Tax=Friedmanniomyces simplex TaxID=329884 RepID=A0A4U0XU24_9PEZI|nr:hypothetical protein B0A55_02554 [Friedmanniomyces simplex]
MAGAHLKVLALISLPWTSDSQLLTSLARTSSTSAGSAKSEDYRQELITTTPVQNIEDASPDPNAASLAQIKNLRFASPLHEQTAAVAGWLELIHAEISEVAEPATPSSEAKARPRVHVIVMGVTGSGKSYFIQVASGRDDVGVDTSEVQPFEFEYEGHHITLIDTLGFNDTDRSETEVLRSLAEYLAFTYRDGSKLTGIIYLQSITDQRIDRSTHRNLKILKRLIGPHAFRNVIFATTKWGHVRKLEAEAKESHLCRDEEFWAPMIERGARVARFDDTRESAMQMVLSLTHQESVVLQIQEELVDQGKKLKDTTAGIAVYEENERLERTYRERLAQSEEMDEALPAREPELQEDFERSTAQYQRKLNHVHEQQDLLKREKGDRVNLWRRGVESATPEQDGIAKFPRAVRSTPADHPTRSLRRNIPRIVVGVDYGTCYSALSFVTSGKGDVEDITVVRTWPGSDGEWKVTSRIAYASENRLTNNLDGNAWGYLVERSMTSCSWTKLLLDAEVRASLGGDTGVNPPVDIRLPLGLSAQDVVTDFLRELHAHMIAALTREFSQQVLDCTPIDFWLTAPDLWIDQAYSDLHAAARAAGFASGQEDTFNYVGDSEAGALTAVRAFLHLLSEKFRTAKVLQTREHFIICSACGSTSIDRNLYALMRKRFGQAFERIEERRRGPGSRFMRTWESIKRSFGTRAGGQVYGIGPLRMKDVRNSVHYDADEAIVLLTRNDVEGLFAPVVTEILRMVSDAVRAAEVHGHFIDRIVLVGGFADSEYLFSQLQSWCAANGKIQLFRPEHPEVAAVIGAALRGLQFLADEAA